MTRNFAFERLGVVLECLTELEGFASDLNDDQFSEHLWRAKSAVQVCGSNLARSHRTPPVLSDTTTEAVA